MQRYLKPDEAGAMIAISPKTLANWRASIMRGFAHDLSEFD